MFKEGKSIYLNIYIVLLVVLIAETFFFIFDSSDNKSLTGFSIGSGLSGGFQNMSMFARVFILSQWLALLLVFLFSGFKSKPIEEDPGDINDKYIAPEFGKKKTDIDILYEILQDKKQLKISTVTKVFKVNKDVAMEWGKILESGNLAVIDYPGFGEPVLNIFENTKIDSNPVDSKKKNDA
jgi:hypothetical protein